MHILGCPEVKISQIFLARAFGARDVFLHSHFVGEARQNRPFASRCVWRTLSFRLRLSMAVSYKTKSGVN